MAVRFFFKSKRRRRRAKPTKRWGARKKSWKIPWRPVGQVAGLLLGLLILATVFKKVDRELFAFQIFEIRHVEIVGLEEIGELEILQRLGLKNETVLTHVDLGGLQERLLGHPRVEAVSIHKGYPDRLHIEIKERQPMVAVKGNGSTWFWVDREGYVLNQSQTSPTGLIRFKGGPNTALAVGDRLNPEQFSSGLNLVRALEEVDAISGPLIVNIRQKNNVHLEMEGIHLQFGDGNFETKLGRYLDVKDDLKHKGIQSAVIDLRFPGKVVVKPKRGEM